MAAKYAGWLSAAATQAEQVSGQANAIVAVFDAAKAAIVHPLEVAANRAGLVQLVTSNLFGQNAPAIAAAEAGYEAMWAQDVAAMSGYFSGASRRSRSRSSGHRRAFTWPSPQSSGAAPST